MNKHAKSALQSRRTALAVATQLLVIGTSAWAQTAPPASAASADGAAKTAAAPAATKPAAATVRADDASAGSSTNVMATVLVTGTVGATEAKRANVSFSVLDAKDLGRFTPISADDYLRDMPGVFVESVDGVARNESYTRGMVLGFQNGPNPTSGNFWTSILEDGLPVVPAKFSNFQDSNFYRADISTCRVESIRGGSAGTTVASSSGAVFNFMGCAIKPGGAVTTRLGWTGESSRQTWRQVDAVYGWVDETSGVAYGLNGFVRQSTAPGDTSFKVNQGGQFKLRAEKSYGDAQGAGGRVSVVLKHLDDTNSWGAQVWRPTYGYADPQPTGDFGRDSVLWVRDSDHTVRTDAQYGSGSSRDLHTSNGANYKQDAVWLKWEHDTGGRWSFDSAVRLQRSSVFAQQAWANATPSALGDIATFRDTYITNQGDFATGRSYTGGTTTTTNPAADLNRLAGTYELFDRSTGQVVARVRNNVGTSSGIDYRSGAACAAGTATSPAACVLLNKLPNADYELRGGIINGMSYPTATNLALKDMVVQTVTNGSVRSSTDFMLNLGSTYSGDNYKLQAGVFAYQARQNWVGIYRGSGLSAWTGDGITNLGARFVTDTAGTYQLTDSGGWGKNRLDGDSNSFIYNSVQRDVQPMLAFSWSPGNWDISGSYKGSFVTADTTVIPLMWAAAGIDANSRSYGGYDGDAHTWYDNQPYVRANTVASRHHTYLSSRSGSVGYNITPNDKVYFRTSNAGNNISGVVSRYGSQFVADNKPLYPQVGARQDEVAWIFSHGPINGQLTYFRTDMHEAKDAQASNVDNSIYTVEWEDHYVSKGWEASLNWRILSNLSWKSAAMTSKTRIIQLGSFNAKNPGPDDDALTYVVDTTLQRVPKWILSNTWSYQLGDFGFNLRHRYMSKRKVNRGDVDRTYLPAQRNFDLSTQYVGIKKFTVSLEVRNLLNSTYVANMASMLSGKQADGSNGPSLQDIMEQAPNSSSRLMMNDPRSYWLTARYDF
jgi:hypothetical protein